MTHIDRRTFLGAAGALALSSGFAGSATASERVKVGVIGVRGRGTDLAGLFAGRPDVEVVALCDIDDSAFARPLQALEKIEGVKAPRVEKDFRRLLDDKNIDAVAIAAPDHWHALLAVMACQAGKDVYTEKPASHNVVEGRRMVEAARKYHRVVQVGTQRRSTPHVIDAVAHLKSGWIGKVGMARSWIMQKRPAIGPGKLAEVPAGVDYAMWQGPALDRPFMSNRFHYNWHWFWNWGTGELGNNGIHGLDVARWALGLEAPTHVTSGGGNYILNDREVPDTQVVTWEFPTACIVWEHRLWDKHPIDGSFFGITFHGDQGTLTIDNNGWRVNEGKEAGGKATPGEALHVANFVEAIKSRQAPSADVEIGHLSTRLCHLGNIAHRVGRKIAFDPSTESIPGDPEANALLGREYSHRFAMPTAV